MLSQMSSNEDRLLQILAGLPQNKPADDPGHWPGDVQEVWQEAGQGAGPRIGQGVGPGAEGLDWVLGQHEAIPWEGHGADHGAGQEAGPEAGQGAGHGASHGAREGVGQEVGRGAGQGAGLGAVELDCALGQHENIGHVVVGATRILNMCTMLEKAKQRKKIHQATIAMLSQMSSNEGRLLQILAGLPQNQPANDPRHWPQDVQEVGQEVGQGAGPETGQGAGPGAEGLDWVLGQHEVIPWEGHGAGQKARQRGWGRS
nr:uncharacterized protein LOC125422053 [Ziziphus jujuba var. spinosa]